MHHSSVTTWLHRAVDGDSRSAKRIWQLYAGRLIRLAARDLRKSSKRLADEEDLVLTVFEEFLRKARKGIYPQLENRDDFWQIILQITHRRAIDHARRARAYDHRVHDESAMRAADGAEQSGADYFDLRASTEVSPAAAAAFLDDFEMLLAELETDELRKVVQCRLMGMTDNEIAQHIGSSLRTVERRLQQIRRAWRKLLPPHASQ